MAVTTDAGEYECPHCHETYVANDDDQYADDLTDECARQCQTCGKWFQVVCVFVDVFLETFPAKRDGEDQSELSVQTEPPHDYP